MLEQGHGNVGPFDEETQALFGILCTFTMGGFPSQSELMAASLERVPAADEEQALDVASGFQRRTPASGPSYRGTS